MTYNALYTDTDSDQISAVIEAHDPDVVGLNELRISTAQDLANQISEIYPYHRIEASQSIFSRYPIKDYTTFVMAKWDWKTRLAQQCVVDIEGHLVTLIHAHPYPTPLELKRVTLMGIPLGLKTK